MNQRLKTTLLIFFVLTTLGVGILAWQQQRSLNALSKPSGSADDSADLRKRLADAEQRAHSLQNELDALKAKQTSEENAGDEPPPPGENDDRRGRFRGRGPEAFAALMNDPKFVALMNSRDRMLLDSRYASLFKSLLQNGKITPEQLETFKNLLVERQNTMRDVMISAREQGLNDRSQINQLVKQAEAELDAQLQSTLGADGYAQFQQYEKTAPQRGLVNQLSQSLSYTHPLTDAQAEQLVQILAANSTSNGQGGGRRGEFAIGGFAVGPGGMMGGGTTITDMTISQASTVLSADQLKALQNIQAQQTAQRELMQSMRNARPSTSSGTQGSATNAGPATAAK
ncbi:MAG: hypothetical protein QM790_05225 [Nibricoccus sp.]